MQTAYGSAADDVQQVSPVFSQPPFSLHNAPVTVERSPSIPDEYAVNQEQSLPSSATTEARQRVNSMFSSGHSPRLEDLLLPGTDMNQPPPAIDPRPPQSPRPYQPSGWSPPQMDVELTTDPNDDVEEIFRPPGWSYRSPSPAQSESSNSSSNSLKLYQFPSVDSASPDSLLNRFMNDTCGILSVKDGVSENPWRNLIGPLAHDSPALMNAILSMTAFHSSQAEPKLRLTAVTAMNESIKDLITNMDNIKLDTALATTIALAFAEGWDRHTSTGIQHLRGSKAILQKALQKKHKLNINELTRLRFLSNTWIYMDVIARLTSFNQDESWSIDNAADLENVMSSLSPSSESSEVIYEVDPLMGCATTLFPIIGRVASLVQRIRRGEQYSFGLIEQAGELKEQVERWKPPEVHHFEEPEDQHSQVPHSLQTAEAYRYATLLYLHQAVPTIPSESSANLADKVLHCLATVPLTSRTTIVHIYPLLAAGCELRQPIERAWVEKRWDNMSKRMRIGNVDKCIEVMKEVWRRRDDFEATRSLRPPRRGPRGMPIGFGREATAGIARSSPDLKRRASTLDSSDETEAITAAREFPTADGVISPSSKKRAMANGFGRPSAVGVPTSQETSTSRSQMPSASPVWRAPPDIVREQLEEEYTVRGSLHWSSVMKDHGWEGNPRYRALPSAIANKSSLVFVG